MSEKMTRALLRLKDRGKAYAVSKYGYPVWLIEECEVPKLGPNDTGHVYVVGVRQYVKIGWSHAVVKRILALQAANPDRLLIYAIIPGRPELERQLHERFRRERMRREWFERDGEISLWLMEGCPVTDTAGEQKVEQLDGLGRNPL